MSFEKAKYANLGQGENNSPVFAGGLVEDMEQWRIKDGSTPYMRNGRLVGMRTVNRLGHRALRTFGPRKRDVNGALTTQGDHYGIGSFVEYLHYSVGPSANSDKLVGLYQDPLAQGNDNGDYGMSVIDIGLYNETFTRTVLPTYNYTQGRRFDSCEVGGKIFFFNSEKAPFSYDTNTQAIVEGCITSQSPDNSNMKPGFGTIFDGRLWVAGDMSSPEHLYRSSQSDPMNFSYPAPTSTPSYGNYDNGGTLKFNERITGLTTTAQALFVFTPQSVSVTYQDSERIVGSAVSYPFGPLEAKEGCTNNATIIPVNNQVYYLSGDNKIMVIERQRYGVYVAQGLSNRLGKALDTTMTTLDQDQSKAFGVYSPISDEIRWHVKTKGSTNNDLVVVYNVQKDEFYFDDGKKFYHAIAGSGKVYATSQIKPVIYEDEYGSRDGVGYLESSLGEPIHMMRVSKRFAFGDPTMNKEFWQTRTLVRLSQDSSIIQKVYIDGALVSEKSVFGNTSSGVQSIIPYNNDYFYDVALVVDKDELYLRGKWMQVVWESYSGGVSLENFDVKLEGLNQLTTDYK